MIRWHVQYAVHALVHHGGVLPLRSVRIVRYGFRTVAVKNRCIIKVEPGEAVAVPIFADADSTEVRHESFRVGFVIFHVGDQVDQGHYQTAIAVPADSTRHSWSYWNCDENRPPRRATQRDSALLDRNAYIVGLDRAVQLVGWHLLR